MATRVINIRDLGTRRTMPPDHVYVGRGFHRNGWELPCSIFFNPFKVEPTDTDHSQACAKYADYIERNKEVMHPSVRTLKGKTLVCWCKPKQCHADLLAQLADSL